MIEQNKSLASMVRVLVLIPTNIPNLKKKYGEEFIEAVLPNNTSCGQFIPHLNVSIFLSFEVGVLLPLKSGIKKAECPCILWKSSEIRKVTQ
ncbi:hypothetical protein MM221_10295 [Salipaludibacillus sp. LMS25]|jgi:hypothetical protein|uniref:hypothetical protein n=1 Tax=Salipaludibacillus sp. LMS25 TaxID=2924031 RepID=UPI0020D04209|nr:hypothetical protein [Salipaludibacillus sp. LMS25]UTR16861.1 hypothetical protein MM221_10295 [Salipaludibacillus sp. LMS25]